MKDFEHKGVMLINLWGLTLIQDVEDPPNLKYNLKLVRGQVGMNHDPPIVLPNPENSQTRMFYGEDQKTSSSDGIRVVPYTETARLLFGK